MAGPAGPLETAVRVVIEPREETWADPGSISAQTFEGAYRDAAEAREALNAHMGWLQRQLEQRGPLTRAEAREGREHERETDPILRPDGQF